MTYIRHITVHAYLPCVVIRGIERAYVYNTMMPIEDVFNKSSYKLGFQGNIEITGCSIEK